MDLKPAVSEWTDERIDQFFDQLLEACNKPAIYSVVEIATNMGVPYDQVKAWAASNENRRFKLAKCRESCEINTVRDGLMKKLPADKAIPYMIENDDETAAYYEALSEEEKQRFLCASTLLRDCITVIQ